MLPGDHGTLISQSDGTFVNHPTNPEYDGTMLHYGDGTMLNHGDGTMVKHDTGPGSAMSR